MHQPCALRRPFLVRMLHCRRAAGWFALALVLLNDPEGSIEESKRKCEKSRHEKIEAGDGR
jgi:hypothetical protein